MEPQNKTLTKLQNNSILIPLVIVAILFFLCSCGSRRVDKLKTETSEKVITETTKIDTSKTVTVTDSNVKIVDSSSSEEFTIMPIDSTKEMIVSGKSYFNAKLSHKKVRNNKTIADNSKITETAQNNVIETSKTQSEKTAVIESKVVDKKQFNFLNLWWLLLLIPIGYFVWKRFGNRIG